MNVQDSVNPEIFETDTYKELAAIITDVQQRYSHLSDDERTLITMERVDALPEPKSRGEEIERLAYLSLVEKKIEGYEQAAFEEGRRQLAAEPEAVDLLTQEKNNAALEVIKQAVQVFIVVVKEFYHLPAVLLGMKQAQPKQISTQPPEFATYLLWYLPMNKKIRDAVIGDLEEDFHTVYNRFGRRKAVAWYYYQVTASFWPFLASKVRSLIRLGFLTWLGEMVRRYIP